MPFSIVSRGCKDEGVYKGRKPSVPVEEVGKMHRDGKGPPDIAVALGVSRTRAHSEHIAMAPC